MCLLKFGEEEFEEVVEDLKHSEVIIKVGILNNAQYSAVKLAREV